MNMKFLSKFLLLFILVIPSIIGASAHTEGIAINLPESFYTKKEEIKKECAKYLELYYQYCCYNFDENDDVLIQERLDGFRFGKNQFKLLAMAHTTANDELEYLKRGFDKELQVISESLAKKEVYNTLAGFHLGDVHFHSQSFTFEKHENYKNPIDEYNRFQVIVQKNKRMCEKEIKAEGCDCRKSTDGLIEHGFSTIRRELSADRLGKELKSRLK